MRVPLALLPLLLVAARALVAPPPTLSARSARALPQRASSPFDGLANAFKGAFANDDEYARPAAAAVEAGPAAEGCWAVELRLVGIPQKDPSNDLFGPRVKITDRERGLSAEEVSATVLLTGGDASVVDASAPLFADDGGAGAYAIAKDGRLSVRLACAGFTRTFTTTGSLQSVFGGDSTSRTSSVYAVPEGPLLLTGSIETLSNGQRFVRGGDVSCVEARATGLFGAGGVRTSVAGTFSATAPALPAAAPPA